MCIDALHRESRAVVTSGRRPDRRRRGAARRRAVRLRRAPGSSPARTIPPCCTGKTSNIDNVEMKQRSYKVNLTLRIWRQKGPGRARARWSPTGAGRLTGHVVPRGARRPQRTAHPGRAGSDRVRQRLPRRHLRSVRAGHQRRCTRATGPDHNLRTAHAQLRRRRRDRRRAVARDTVSRHQGPRRRPQRHSTGSSRPADTSPHQRAPLPTRRPCRCPRRAPKPRSTQRPASVAAPALRHAPTARRRCSLRREDHPPGRLYPRASPNVGPARSPWSTSTTPKGSAGCTQIGECTAVCPKGIQLDVISRYHRDVLSALLHRED